MSRPAETTGVAGAIALVIARVAGVTDATVLVAIGAVTSSAPAAVTLLVHNGGLSGVLRMLWGGKSRDVAAVESKRKRS